MIVKLWIILSLQTIVVNIGLCYDPFVIQISLFCSDFINIFDVDWFISYLAKDVPIVKRVPEKVMRSMDKPPYTMRVPRKSEPDYYLEQVLPILLRRRVRAETNMAISNLYLGRHYNCYF